MSSAMISTSAALGRPFLFDTQAVPEVSLPSEQGEKELSQARPPQRLRGTDRSVELALSDPRLAHITPGSRLAIRPAPEMVSSGVPAIDALTGGLPRGCLTEICGPASSGRTTLLLSAVAAATHRGEFCVVIDASDALDPHSAAAAGVDLRRLLWVRCNEGSIPKKSSKKPRAQQKLPQTDFDFNHANSWTSERCLEQVLRATDLLLESGGFGLIVLDLADLPHQAARRIPLTTWFRFRRAVENKPTILLAIEQHPIAGSCSSVLLRLGAPDQTAAERHKNAAHGPSASLRVNSSRGSATENEQAPEGRNKICIGGDSAPTHAQLLTGLDITAELILSRLNRKPAHSVTFASKTTWAG